MKVKEYLVNRILKLEEELKQARNEKSGIAYALQKLQEDVIKLNEKIEQYQIEREHIREIITCNIMRDELNIPFISLYERENDFKTLLSILDIKPEDYEVDKDIIAECTNCIYKHLSAKDFPCDICDNNSEFIEEKEDNNAEAKD